MYIYTLFWDFIQVICYVLSGANELSGFMISLDQQGGGHEPDNSLAPDTGCDRYLRYRS